MKTLSYAFEEDQDFGTFDRWLNEQRAETDTEFKE